MNEYQQEIQQFWNTEHEWDTQVAHALVGIMSEAGEVADEIKKPFYSNRPDLDSYSVNRAKLELELGDLLFYVAILASLFELDLDTIMTSNVIKLTGRYGK